MRTDPPAVSGGVAVALVAQRCGRRVRRDLNEILDLVLDVRVTNDGRAPVRIGPTHLQLLVGGDATPPDGAGPPVDLASGRASELRLHFHRWGNATCAAPMSLSLDDALERGGRPLRLRALTFVPEAGDV